MAEKHLSRALYGKGYVAGGVVSRMAQTLADQKPADANSEVDRTFPYHPEDYDWKANKSGALEGSFNNEKAMANAKHRKETIAAEDAREPREAPEDKFGSGYPGYVRGGKIKRVSGKPVGKDDGVIAAQRGEFVVRKSAVKKLGTAVLNEVNNGKLPERVKDKPRAARLYGKKGVSRG